VTVLFPELTTQENLDAEIYSTLNGLLREIFSKKYYRKEN